MSATPYVIDVSVQNFQTEVVDKSRSTPVLLEFYADGAEPSMALAPVLRRLADEYQGKFILARVEIRTSSQLVQQLGVRTLPTLKLIVDGQMAQSLEGPQEEAELRRVLDESTMTQLEQVRARIDQLLEIGDRDGAIVMLQDAIAAEPANFGLHTELCDLLIMSGRSGEAEQILESLPEDAPGIERPKHRLHFIKLAADLAPLIELESAVAANETDLPARYALALALVVDDQIDRALEQLLEMMRIDRTYDEELPRTTMIKVFDLLGKGNPTVAAYRRKMFALLH